MSTAAAAFVLLFVTIGRVSCFLTPHSTLYPTSLSATRAPEEQKVMESSYSPAQLKDALDSLNDGSSNPDFDARHIYGYKDPNHKLSMLQTITANTILDYREIMVRSSSCCLCVLCQTNISPPTIPLSYSPHPTIVQRHESIRTRAPRTSASLLQIHMVLY